MHLRRILPPSAALLCLVFFACAQPGPEPPASPAIERTEILWDEWGVPHIFAPDTDGLFYAHGWAQAKSHGDLLLRLYGRSRGRAAEYWGESYLDGDKLVHTLGVPRLAAEWYEAQTPQFRSAFDAFAHGINDYVGQHGEEIDDEVEAVLPVVATDVIAHLLRVLHFGFVARLQGLQGLGPEPPGSNAWAIAPQRTADGHAILVANPHLPWSSSMTWYESQLVTPEVNITGAALLGDPFHGIGFNDHLGWTHTVNTHDGVDLYELTLKDGGYLFDGEVREFERQEVTLHVAGGDDETLVVKRSVHGPVVEESAGKAVAARVVGLHEPHLFDQYWDMARAENLAQFEAAQKKLQMPMFTTMYADRDGRILHVFGGRTPRRSSGGWDDWAGKVDGTSSANLWTETLPYEELPKVLDPASGWLQNANDPPWTTTFPAALNPDDFPPYLAPRFMSFRAQQSARMLMDDESFTFDEVVAAKLNTQMRAAERLLDDVEAAVEAHGGDAARRAWDVLAAWDHTADAESRGGVLFERFMTEMQRSHLGFATPWDESHPMTTPDGLADPKATVAALERAATAVEEEHGALDVAWGDVYRLRRGQIDLPANGGPGGLGIFRVLYFAPEEGGHGRAVAGDSYVAIIEFSDPIQAETLLSYGNSSQPGSPHNGDQLELFAKKELRPVWRTREEIEAHLEERETF